MKKKKDEVIFSTEKPAESKPSEEEKIGMAGGIAGFFKTAMDQISGTGDYELKPSEKPGETAVDKVKDQIIGAGDFDHKSIN